MNLIYQMDEYAEEKRTEQNLFERSGKSEAEVTNSRKLRLTYIDILKVKRCLYRHYSTELN